MGTRFISLIVIVAMLFAQSACVIRTQQKIATDEYVENPNPMEEEMDDPEKILFVVLSTGEIIEFDERGGRYLERSRMIRGTTKGGDDLLIEIDDVEYVGVKRKSETLSIAASLAIFVGIITAVALWIANWDVGWGP